MKYKYKMAILSLILFSSVAFARPAETVRDALTVSARVVVGDVIGGSAVAVKEYGRGTLFMSNDHVCQWSRGISILKKNPNYLGSLNKAKIVLHFANGSSALGKVVYLSNSTNPFKKSVVSDDLCLIYVDKKIKPSTLSQQDSDVGEEVFSVGAPHGLFPHIAGGYVGAYFHNVQQNAYVGSASLVIGEGSSGGGIFDKATGELIGIAFAIEPVKDDVPAPLLAYYVPISKAQAFMEIYLNKSKELK